jgi:hypothetical protein
MQELHADRDFFDWLRGISGDYGEAMAAWGQEVHDAVARPAGIAVAVPERLLQATDATVERLVQSLVAIGARHDDPQMPQGAAEVLEALDRLLGASAELLRGARSGLEQQGLAAVSVLAPSIAELRRLEAEVEHRTEPMRDRLESTFGDPGAP